MFGQTSFIVCVGSLVPQLWLLYRQYRVDLETIPFICFAQAWLCSNVLLPLYEDRLQLINLPSFRKRRLVLGIIFMIKLINGEIDSVNLLKNIRFNVPYRFTRNYVLLKLDLCRYNYEEFNPFYCLCSQLNDLYNYFSIV